MQKKFKKKNLTGVSGERVVREAGREGEGAVTAVTQVRPHQPGPGQVVVKGDAILHLLLAVSVTMVTVWAWGDGHLAHHCLLKKSKIQWSVD